MKPILRPAHEVFGIHELPDFSAHNAETEALWAAYREQRQPRVPVILGVNCRVILLDPRLNPEGVTFREAFEDMDIMLETQLRFNYYMRFFLPSDRPMGLPDHWAVSALTMNTCEAEWFGAEREYIAGDTPDCRPFLNGNNKRALFSKGLPDPFARNAGFVRDCCGYFRSLIDKGYTYEGVPLAKVNPPFTGTDGPVTVACAVRGATELCLDFYEDPDYAHELLNFIADATIARVKAWRKLFGMPEVTDDAPFSFADDSVQLLSPEMYREFVLPVHKKLAASLGNPSLRASTHLCGDASHLFKILRDELNVYGFDTGFPIDHGKMVWELGPEVEMNGGPNAGLLLNGTPGEVARETERILGAVMPHTKRFVLREGNNLPPRCPEENVAAMVQTAKRMRY